LAIIAGCPRAEHVVNPGELPAAARPALDQVPRAELNRFAAELYLPLFWDRDADGDGAVDPGELAVLWMGTELTSREDWVKDGQLTDRFFEAYRRIVDRKLKGPSTTPDASDAERERMALIRRELEQGRPTVIRTDLSGWSEADRAFARHIVAAARVIERLFQQQSGSWSLRGQVPEHDTASRMVFYRNHGPWCEAPETESNPKCNAIPALPKRISGLYPASIQNDKSFCDALKKEPDAEKLRGHFSAVRGDPGKLEAVPYHLAFAEDMKEVATHLDAAANALGPDEAALKAYVLAAAKAFRDNGWEQADEAWAKMNAANSKWYLRIGPDEVYHEPCSLKAGFHTSFARINKGSIEWQTKLEPVKSQMEEAIAKLAGPPYAARTVTFRLPDFIDLVLNAGDARAPLGGTAGQSLPNWGPVANESRGRTVLMTNLGTDPDSREDSEKLAKSVFCKPVMTMFSSDPAIGFVGTILHEATHNFGPAHEYKVDGKKDEEIFGGPKASMLEELKAQTGSLYLTDWLAARNVIERPFANKVHVRNITWALRQISAGMYDSNGKPKPYSQLAAMQFGWLVENGAVNWNPNEMAANDSDKGCFSVHVDAFPTAVEGFMRIVAGIKARGDTEGVKKLTGDYVDVSGDKKAMLELIRERYLRAPRGSYVYALEL
jgi:hypothetical protein